MVKQLHPTEILRDVIAYPCPRYLMFGAPIHNYERYDLICDP